MNGFRNFLIAALVCVAAGLWLSQGPAGCRPPDMGECTFNVDTNQYDCPEDK
jgi:hypothetical protein